MISVRYMSGVRLEGWLPNVVVCGVGEGGWTGLGGDRGVGEEGLGAPLGPHHVRVIF